MRARKFSVYLFLSLLIISSLHVPSLRASEDTFDEVSPEEKKKILANLKEVQKEVSSMVANVNQEKHLAMMEKEIHICGTLMMKKPNLIRLDTTNSDKTITAVDGERLIVYYPDLKEAQVYKLSDNVGALKIMSFFTSTMWGLFSDLEKQYTIEIFRKDNKILLKLTPLSKMVSKHLSSIRIHYDKRSGLPTLFEIITSKGDKIITRLSNIKTNIELELDTFTVKLPEDVWITNNSTIKDDRVNDPYH